MDDARAAARRVLANIESVVDGKPDAVEAALVVLLAEGHLLIEDVPGVGKTVLARALARSVDGSVRRIQFTPDLLPSDITGVSAYNQQRGEFEFKPGAVFANIVIGDEINRASPKTQSALLEAMEERQVTVDGHTHPLATPFSVIATQNPYEMEGTYALPEAQRDRFTARISMGYPDAAAELEMVRDRDVDNPLDRLRPVVTIDEVREMIVRTRAVFVSEAVERYCVDLARATRDDAALRLGASPRATLQLVRAAKARAFVHDREYVLPDDVDALTGLVLPHRLVPARGSAPAEETVQRIVAATPVPQGAVEPR
ncbi:MULTISPECIES: MoxR family ATPase [unclassified Aeromicrobium]|jgi:MoxR-like ATPase|uniref:AAA family ATPase n=1 Tax=unclassified Aeromicrobium TaxID=2633570 RepID=UPI0006F4DABC|nr:MULTISPECIES: AAA family ATPase [unclassified Aeromicrobium]KQO37276.1 ATPase [Aeromicrobium sp. Leaf245]KQP26115.1 ATPase [Aeromicrobium sp. Leaf272]KQP75797.1 ATPase [Aeromicrobium sp. Leaf289]KQP84818.1 ATPase [Aeromicrobium sp. Leaf291]